MKPTKNEDGYLQIKLYKNKKYTMQTIHKLVAENFIDIPKLEVNHLNGIRDDNNVDNLEWCTHAENERYSWKTLGKRRKSNLKIKKKRKESYCLMKFCDIREYILKYQHQLNWDNFINILNENNLSEEINYVLKLISSFYKDVDIERVIKKLNFDESCIEKTDLSLLIQ